MSIKKIQISDVLKKHIRIVFFLVVSGGLGYGLALLVNKPELTVIFAPAINYVLYTIKVELDKEGIVQVIRGE